ncbi:MAG: diguanylate cyclase [Spirochaetales bacterium]|nr:diguanylate cyclase [Spirochaetales bacterium]
MMELPEPLRLQLASLIDDYIKQLPGRITEIDAAFNRVVADPGDIDRYISLRLLVHKLAGSGATFGFDNITDTARAFEQHLSRIIDSGLLDLDAVDSESSVFFAKLKTACSLDEAVVEMDKVNEQSEQIERNSLNKIHRDILLFSREDNASINGLRDQLGFFGFIAEPVADLRKLRTLIKENPKQLAIIHTNAFEKSKTAVESLASLKAAYPDQVNYVFISEKSDFNTRLSALRAGSDAYFLVPLDVAKLIDMVDSLNSEKESEPYHVLIVDDDPEQVAYYALILQQAGMITSVASDPKTVLDVLVESKPELILMDMYMPGCSGTELLSLIRQQEAFVGIPVVFLSVENGEGKKLAAVREGGDDFITKPAEPEFLIVSISTRINRTRNIRYFMERDSLTGLLNHSNLKEQLIREVLRSERAGSSVCFAMIDLDNFKVVNDTYGHLTGDKVLKNLSRILQERLRRTDIIGRYGGEEFGAILLNTHAEDAQRILDEVRDNFSQIRHQAEDTEFSVTFSCGIACFPGISGANEMTNAADKALYQAKEAGRNRVLLASSDDTTEAS